jgi:hypothetical protein
MLALAGALAGAASTQSNVATDDAPSPMEILSGTPQALATATPGPQSQPAPDPGSKPDAAKPDAAKKPEAKASDRSAEYLAQCLKDWDAGTHMTRQEWARTCRRVVSNRVKFLREQGQ